MRTPTISIVTPVYNTPPDVLRECIESVRAQTERNWELCICDDASTDPATRSMLERYHGIDSRIRIVRSSRNLHISEASNLAAQQATGPFLLFLDHDDTLSIDAVSEIRQAIESEPEIDLLYSDEDKIDFDGRHCDPYFKPDWSPEHLLSVMYVLHPLVIRKALFFRLGGFRDEYTGAQDYDLVLRASRCARKIHHIPKILYHWRKVEGSASAEVDAKPYALDAGKRALADFVAPHGEVTDGLLPGLFRVRFGFPRAERVTLLFLTNESRRVVEGRGELVLIQNALESIRERSTYSNYEVLVIHNNEISEETRNLIRKMGGRDVAFNRPGPFNYSERLNFGFDHVETQHVISLNDDIEVRTPDWIEALLEWTHRPDVGIVGARLLYPDGKVQHSGIALVPRAGATHAFYKLGEHEIGYYGFTHLVRNYSAVTGAALGTRMEVVRKVGGLDTRLSTDFNDVDFCLRVQEAGYRVVFTPHCELLHLEGSSLKRTSQDPREVEYFNLKWHELTVRDPYLNFVEIRRYFPHAIDPTMAAPLD